MNNLLIAIAVFVITVMGALFAVPYFIDWNSYRSAFEEEAKNVIGREVQVDGDVTLHLLPTPYVRVEKVRIADTSTNLTEYFFKTDSLSIKLSIAPLLRGVVEANEIEFQRPVLRVALDAKGNWNWQSFAQALRSTGYVPANVTLTSLRIVDGVLAVHGPDGAERTRLDGLNGELSSPALDGPYRFRGTFTSGGATREVRISTGEPEADGKVPLRVSLRHLDSGASYVLDARATDLMGRTRLEGDLTARLPIAGPPPGGLSQRASRSEEEPAVDRSETPLEVKGAFKADVAGAVLSDLTLTFEEGDRPQTVTGSARVAWRTPVSLDMDLASRWLDLDRLAGAAEGTAPVASVVKLATWVRDLLPGEGLARLNLAIDQANLAGESIGPLRLAMARSAKGLDIGDLRVALPGGSRVDLKGNVIAGKGDALAFNGNIGLKGASAGRFAAWASGNKLAFPADADGPFELRTGVAVDATGLALRDLAGTLAGTTFKGGGRYQWAGQPELTVALEGSKFDARALLPADASLFDLFQLASQASRTGPADKRAAASGGMLSRLRQADLDLHLKAGQLVTATRTYRDFSTAVVSKDGQLKQLQLNLAGDGGFSLQMDGKVNNLATGPKGSVHGHVTAETPDSITPLAALFGVPSAFRPGDSRARAMTPLRLAGSLALGRRTPTSADLAIDGESGGAAVKVNARFEGGTGGWRGGRADITATVDSNDAGRIAGLLYPQPVPVARAGAKPGLILLRAAGIPSEGLTTLASIDAGDIALNFRGQVATTDAGGKAEGDLDARASNGTALAALAGFAPALRADGIPVSARLKLAVDGGMVSMDKLALQVGGTRLSGRIDLAQSDGRRRIDAALSADDLSIAALLSPLLDRRFGAASAAEAVLGQASPWPDEPFSVPVLDAFEGQIRLNCKRLALADGLALERAKLNVVLQPGKVDAGEVSGKALGGDVKATLTIEKAATGASVKGTLGFGIALGEIAGPRPPRAAGPMNGRLEFAGRGISPRAIVSALQGEGSVAFGGARLPGLAPAAVAGASAAALKAESTKLAPTLRQALAAALGTGSVAVGQATVALEIADGQVRGRPLVVDTGEGRASGTARLDLKTLKFDSQWRVEAKLPDGAGAARSLPAVMVSYRAPVAALRSAELQIDSTALEQELAARKIAQDMEELDRLRRLNEAADPSRKPPQPAAPALPPGPAVPAAPTGPTVPIPPFGHEVRPDAPG